MRKATAKTKQKKKNKYSKVVNIIKDYICIIYMDILIFLNKIICQNVFLYTRKYSFVLIKL